MYPFDVSLHVLEDIRRIGENLSTAEISALFYEGTYTASNGKKNPLYLMNRDGFTLLGMGYTGDIVAPPIFFKRSSHIFPPL